jgi:hypothetical protein
MWWWVGAVIGYLCGGIPLAIIYGFAAHVFFDEG